MFKVILLTLFIQQINSQCAYWCEAPCIKKTTAFYCCSFEPSLAGPQVLLFPPCENLCLNRTNEPSYMRNCKEEFDELRANNKFQKCRNFNDCNPEIHDLCCTDNCLPEQQKICITL